MNLLDVPCPVDAALSRVGDVEDALVAATAARLHQKPSKGVVCPKSRKAVDWESVERHYRAGLLSIRELGKQFGVSHVAIQKKAKAEGWVRDLSAKIRANARAALVTTPEVTSAVTVETKRSERELVETAAATIVQVVREHRQDIAKARRLVETLLDKLEAEVELKLPAQAGTLRDLTMALKTLVALEREAFSVDEKEPGEKAPNGETPLEVFEARIATLTGATANATDE